MSAKPQQAPYFDASLATDAASFVSTLPPPSYHTADDNESIAPLIDSSPNGPQHYTQSPPLVTPSAAAAQTAQDGEEDKIIMTSIPVRGSTSPSPRKSIFNKIMPSNKLKIVLMPQSEYNKYFAKDKAGNYIGTEPQREWTEAELDERYGKYKSTLPMAPMRVGSAWKEGGGWASYGGFGGGMGG
jgi:hypothetical protein